MSLTTETRILIKNSVPNKFLFLFVELLCTESRDGVLMNDQFNLPCKNKSQQRKNRIIYFSDEYLCSSNQSHPIYKVYLTQYSYLDGLETILSFYQTSTN